MSLVPCYCSDNGQGCDLLCEQSTRDSCEEEIKKDLWIQGWIPFGSTWVHPQQPDFPFDVVLSLPT